MNGYKFTRREKVILTILGMLLLLRLIITLIIFRCYSRGTHPIKISISAPTD